MLELLGYSGQLNRRKKLIYIPRMDCSDEAGLQEFVEFLMAIEQDYRIEDGLLRLHAGDIHFWTYGIPGEVVGLMDRAKMTQHARGDQKLIWGHIEEERHSDAELAILKAEADIIYAVMKGDPLSTEQKKVVERRKNKRMSARRVRTGASA